MASIPDRPCRAQPIIRTVSSIIRHESRKLANPGKSGSAQLPDNHRETTQTPKHFGAKVRKHRKSANFARSPRRESANPTKNEPDARPYTAQTLRARSRRASRARRLVE